MNIPSWAFAYAARVKAGRVPITTRRRFFRRFGFLFFSITFLTVVYSTSCIAGEPGVSESGASYGAMPSPLAHDHTGAVLTALFGVAMLTLGVGPKE